MSKLRVVQERWAEKHIAAAERSAAQKISAYKRQHQVVFWVMIGIAVGAHLLLSATVVPFLLFFQSLFFDAVALLAALLIGVMYIFVIGNVLHIERRHHFLAAVVVPVIATIIVFILGNSLRGLTSPLPFALLYGIAFVVPYAFHFYRAKAVAVKNRHFV